MCAFIFPRRHRRWITLWTVRLMGHRRSWVIKMKSQSARWAGWPQSKTGRGSWSQHRPLPAEFWWDRLHTYTHRNITRCPHTAHPFTITFRAYNRQSFVTCYDTVSTLRMTCFCVLSSLEIKIISRWFYGCFVKYGLISMPHVIKGFWECSNTERWLVWVALILAAVSARTVLDTDRSINYEQLSQFTT